MNDGRLLVVCKDDSTLEVIDLESSKRVGAVTASGFTPHEVVATGDGRFAYMPVYSDAPVGSPGSDGRRVDIVDLLTFQRVGDIRLAFPSRPHQSSLLTNDRVIISTELDESVTVIDRRTLRVVARLPTGEKLGSQKVACSKVEESTAITVTSTWLPSPRGSIHERR